MSNALNRREHIVRLLRDFANAIESKPDSCIITRIPTGDEDNGAIRIITDFERTERGIQRLVIPELTISYLSRVSSDA